MKVRDAVSTWMRREGASEKCITNTVRECEIMFGGGDVELPGTEEEIIAKMSAVFHSQPPEFWSEFMKKMPQKN